MCLNTCVCVCVWISPASWPACVLSVCVCVVVISHGLRGGACVEHGGGLVCVEGCGEAPPLSRPEEARDGVEAVRHDGTRDLQAADILVPRTHLGLHVHAACLGQEVRRRMTGVIKKRNGSAVREHLALNRQPFDSFQMNALHDPCVRTPTARVLTFRDRSVAPLKGVGASRVGGRPA